MSEETPVTDHVRGAFIDGRTTPGAGNPRGLGEYFDRWLAGIKAEAWAEGFSACYGYAPDKIAFDNMYLDEEPDSPSNPYEEVP